MAAGNLITVVEKDSGDTLIFSEDNLISMVGEDSGNDSRIKYLTNNRTVNNVLLETTVAALVILAPKLLPFTLTSDGSTLYVNGERIKESFPDGSGSTNFVDVESSAWEQFKFTETPAEVATDVNT